MSEREEFRDAIEELLRTRRDLSRAERYALVIDAIATAIADAEVDDVDEDQRSAVVVQLRELREALRAGRMTS